MGHWMWVKGWEVGCWGSRGGMWGVGAGVRLRHAAGQRPPPNVLCRQGTSSK